MTLPFSFDKIRHHQRPHLPLPQDRCGVIGWEDLETGYGVGAKVSSASKLTDTSAAKHSPHRSVAKAYNKIWINGGKLVSQPVKLWLELGADVFRFRQRRVAGDGVGLTAAELKHIVPLRVKVEDVGEMAVSAVDACLGEHPSKLKSAWANKSGTFSFFGFTPGFSYDGDVGHCPPQLNAPRLRVTKAEGRGLSPRGKQRIED